jgi:anti-sigma regulatory factor (Ser/Thr protein kinase)
MSRYSLADMGQTRVDLQHLLEDLRDAYPDAIEETILSEIVANALDSGARTVRVLTDAGERTIVVIDDGCGMSRRDLARYHDLAASSKTRGEGIGFAGVGIKLGLLVAESVLTESRRGAAHVATRWHLASRHRAPWHWVATPPGWVSARGTAVGLHLRNPLSPLLDARFVESRLRLHFEPLLDPAFDEILRERYPDGIIFAVNGRLLERVDAAKKQRAPLIVRLPRKRKPAAFGFLERTAAPLPEERQGLAVSTLGKVIRRGWDWIGLSSVTPGLVGGLIEAPGLAAALTLNKGDFVRAGRRGITYLAYRKAVQEAVQGQLAAWGEARDREESLRRRATRPLERDLEGVLFDLASEFPALSALVERRPNGQKRLPSALANDAPSTKDPRAAAAPPATSPEAVIGERESEAATGGDAADPHVAGSRAADDGAPSENASQVEATRPEPPGESVLSVAIGAAGPRRPTRYGLAVEFEERPELRELGRLVESTVLVNTAHPAYVRAVASRSDGYHAALTVGMSLAAVAVEAPERQGFLTAFLARWGKAVGRDRRRRQPGQRRE